MTKAIPVAASVRTCRRLDARPSTVMPEEWKAQTGGPDAIFLAIGRPHIAQDHASLRGAHQIQLDQ
jgi:hypothetical protein